MTENISVKSADMGERSFINPGKMPSSSMVSFLELFSRLNSFHVNYLLSIKVLRKHAVIENVGNQFINHL